MRAGSSRIIFGFAFVLALAAGVAAGVLATRFSIAQPQVPPLPNNSVIPTLDELQLSDDQRARIQKVWEGVKDLSDTSYRQANRLQQQFDDKVKAILTPQQMDQYTTFYDEYQREFHKLERDRDAAVKKLSKRRKPYCPMISGKSMMRSSRAGWGNPNSTIPSTEMRPELPNTAAKGTAGSEL